MKKVIIGYCVNDPGANLLYWDLDESVYDWEIEEKYLYVIGETTKGLVLVKVVGTASIKEDVKTNKAFKLVELEINHENI